MHRAHAREVDMRGAYCGAELHVAGAARLQAGVADTAGGDGDAAGAAQVHAERGHRGLIDGYVAVAGQFDAGGAVGTGNM